MSSPSPRLEPGGSTAGAHNVRYRLNILRAAGLLHGRWLDCGCADGGYSRGLAATVDSVIGIDVIATRVDEAQRLSAGISNLTFEHGKSESLPFATGSFDGVLLNEVLEHVEDERRTLREIHRVLRPGGALALFSPNRWFPFEGHGIHVGKVRWDHPTPLVPWLPTAVTAHIVHARNYWPSDLARLVEQSGLEVTLRAPVFPVFEFYPWLPNRIIRWYRRALPRLDQVPIVRNFGVSTLIIGRKRLGGQTD